MSAITANLIAHGWQRVANCLDWRHGSGAKITHEGSHWYVTGRKRAFRTLADAASYWLERQKGKLFV